MRRVSQIITAIVLTVCVSLSAHAVPILIDYGLIAPRTQEDFQSIPLGDITPQFSFNGFDLSDPGPADILDTACDGNDANNRCLAYGNGNAPMRFFNLSANAFGLEIITSSSITAVVQGNSGSSSFELSSGLFAFYDILGLVDISISPTTQSGGGQCSVNCGRPGGPFNRNPTPGIGWGDNLYIDDVITQANLVVDLSEPAPLASFGAALIGLAMFRTKRHPSKKPVLTHISDK